MNGEAVPPAVWTRILRLLVRGDEGARVEEALAELYALRRAEAPGTENGWYRRQVLGFAMRLPALPRQRISALDVLRQDLGFAFRQFRRRPGFALLATLTAGLGIGAATAIFGMVRAVVLEPLPFPEPERLVTVVELTQGGGDFPTSEPNIVAFRERNRTFSGLAAFQFYDIALRLPDRPVQLRALRASADFFDVLGGRATLGRVFTEGEAGAQPAPVVVLSHSLWRDAFGADAAVPGRTIVLDGVAHTVIGVMPAGWQPFGETDVWLPQRLDPAGDRDGRYLEAVGRLADGQTTAGARADLISIQEELGQSFPESNGGWSMDVRPLKQEIVGADTILAGWTLLGAVGLLLLLSCASVSNLLIARAATRRREITLRTALGASTGRVLRQLMTESVVLALAGGALGIVIAFAALPALRALSPPDTPRLDAVRIDALVLLFAMAVSFAAGLLFGVAPAAHALRADVRGALAEDGRTTTGGPERLRGLLVSGQVAVAFALLVGVGLLTASLLRLNAQDPGLAVRDMLVVPLVLPWDRYDADDRRRVLLETEGRIAAIPGVNAAGFGNVGPFGDWNTVVDLSVEGITFPDDNAPFARWRMVTTRYFDAAGIRIVAGRALEAGDQGPGAGDRAAAVITVAMAEQVWGSVGDALGRRFAMSRNSTNWMRVVGVAADVEDWAVTETSSPLFFFLDGGGWEAMTLIVRAEQGAAALAPAIRRAVWDVDADLPVPTVEPVTERIGRQAAGPRFRTMLMTVFGTVALTLALMAVYGVTHLAVSRRTREIGIRVALGAELGDMVRMLLAHSAVLALAGIVFGIVLALAGARAMQALLFRTSPLDPVVLGGAAVLVLGASLLAAWIPARRALHVDPASILTWD
jgi:putative ABC transport system permease protein